MSRNGCAHRRLRWLLALSLLAATAQAQGPTHSLLVLDRDAHALSNTTAGALFRVFLGSGVHDLSLAADQGAPELRSVSRMAMSPLDGAVYITDSGPDGGAALDGAVHVHRWLSGGVEVLVPPGTPGLPEPQGLAFSADGRLFVVDWEADPLGRGSDLTGRLGHGAVYEVDLDDGSLTLLSDGTSHDVPGIPPTEPVFQDPISIDWAPLAGAPAGHPGQLYVLDLRGDGDDDGLFNGTLFSLDLADRSLRVVSAYWNFAAPVDVEVRPNGRPVIVDSLPDDSLLLEIDPNVADLTDNAIFLSSGLQYSLLQSVAVDSQDKLWVADSGEWDSGSGSWFVPPAIYEVDESRRGSDPDFDLDNAIPVFSWQADEDSLLFPYDIEAVPTARVTDIQPRLISGPTEVRFTGEGLSPGLRIEFGSPDELIRVSDLRFAPGEPLGSALLATLTPLPSDDCTPDMFVTQPFAFITSAWADAVELPGFGAGPPSSSRGDASGDGRVDGLDLARLGRGFGTGACNPLFDNDIDFNDDGLIDGADLALLMTYFGLEL